MLYFFDTPGNSICSALPVWIFFGIAQCKEGVHFFFHLILVGISSVLILSVKNMLIGGWIFLLNRQNLLSVFVDSPF